MPLIPETAIGLLAIAYIGAIAVPAFSGYGPDALSARLADAGAKVLLTVDGVLRRNKPVDMKGVADDALRAAPSVKTVLVFDRTGADVPMQAGRDVRWRDAVAAATPLASYERTSANDRVMLLYTSGSTGKPKGVNHVHGGFPIKCMIDQYLCMDVKPGDRMLWYTDMGWMMGPFLVFGALGLGATIVLYEGTPDFPGPDRLWKICSEHRVTHLGIAPTAIRALMAHGDEPPRKHDLSALRILGEFRRSRGTPNRGSGSSPTPAAGARRSSTTRAAPRSAAASSAVSRRCRWCPTAFTGRSRASSPTCIRPTASRCAAKSANSC